MKPLLYARSCVWDFLLLALASTGLVYTLFNDFYIDPALQFGPVPALVVAVLLLVLFAAAYNRLSTRVVGVIYAVAVIAANAFAATTAQGSFVDDNEGNLFYFMIIITLVPTFGFLLTRKKLGAALYFVAGAFICAWTQFFYEQFAFAWLLMFVVAALALIIYKNYQRSAAAAASVGKLSFAAGFGVACIAVAIAVLAGCGLWFGIVQQLHPGALVIELVNEDRSLEEIEVRGVSGTYQTPNLELSSDRTNDEARTTDDLKVDADGSPVPAHLNSNETSEESAAGTYKGTDVESLDEDFDFDTYEQPNWVLWIVLAVVLLLVLGYFIGRRVRRSTRLSRIAKQSPTQQVQQLFPFLMNRMCRIGLGIPAGSTVAEYASNNETLWSRMDAVCNSSFAAMAQAYERCVYGHEEASEEEASLFVKYYKGFWKAARKELGLAKYFFKSFRL